MPRRKHAVRQVAIEVVEKALIVPTADDIEQDDPVVSALIEGARVDAGDSVAASTKRAYRHDWAAFAGWCREHKRRTLPVTARTLIAYVKHLGNEGYKVATIKRALATIRQAHRRAKQKAPTDDTDLLDVLRGLTKKIGVVQRKAHPFFPEDLRKAHALLGSDLRGIRDRAMSSLSFMGAFRRNEAVKLNVADLVFTPDGKLAVLLRSSKTDQLGEGLPKGIPRGAHEETCPVRTVQAWLAASGIKEGPLFREITLHGVLTERRASDQAVHRLAKKLAKLAELPDPEGYSGHSFRAGLITTADREGKSLTKIMQLAGHRNPKTTQGYMRDTDLFRDNAADGIGM
jgi:site-specific recombinase XerD